MYKHIYIYFIQTLKVWNIYIYIKAHICSSIYIATVKCCVWSQVDLDDQTAKIKVQGVGDVWCADSAIYASSGYENAWLVVWNVVNG